MSYAKNLSDEMSFSFRGTTPGCVDTVNGNGSNGWSLDKKGVLRVSPADIFYEPCYEKYSHTSQDALIDYPEIRFCEKTSQMEIAEEKRPRSVSEHSIAEAPFAGDYTRFSPVKEILHSPQSPFIDENSVALPTLEERSISQEAPGSCLHYTLSEDYFLLFKNAEYQRSTPRTMSKDHFIMCLQPMLGRTLKSISKRMDRLRALSRTQRRILTLYVREFPLKAPFRKAVFESSGEGISVKTLQNKVLPGPESQYMQSISQNSEAHVIPSCSHLEAQHNIAIPSLSFTELGKGFTFIDSDPLFVDQPSLKDNGAEKWFWKKLIKETDALDHDRLEKKLHAIKSKEEEGVVRVRDPTVFSCIVEFLAWSFKLDPAETLAHLPPDRLQSFEEVRRTFLVALPQKYEL